MSDIELDRLKNALAAFIHQMDPNRPYHGLYEYTCVVQAGTLVTCVPSDSDIGLPELTLVPQLRCSCGGNSIIPPGTKVAVGFLNGDPAKPRVLFQDPLIFPIVTTMRAVAIPITVIG